MALESEPGVGGRHALAVVDYLNKGAAGILQYDLNRSGTGIDRILDQLLDDRGRPLYHLARGYLIGHGIGQQMYNITHKTSSR